MCYCYVTSNHQLGAQNNTHSLTYSSVDHSLGKLVWVVCSGSHKVRIQVLNELGSFQKALRKLHASKIILSVNRVQLFVVVGLRLFPFWLLERDPAHLLEAAFRSFM